MELHPVQTTKQKTEVETMEFRESWKYHWVEYVVVDKTVPQ